MAIKKKKKTKTKKIVKLKRVTRNNTVSWTTNGRWGKSKKKGVVKAFIPRGESALGKMPKSTQATQLVGSDRNSFNDRYLIQVETKAGRTVFQTPRSMVIEKAYAKIK